MQELFNNGSIKVETNEVGCIFVTNLDNLNSRMRITPRGNGLIITAHDGIIQPWMTGNLPAFTVSGR